MLRPVLWLILPAAILASFAGGCGLIPGLGTGSGGSSSSSSSSVGGATSTGVGTDCGTDPDTSAVLCLGNSLCPSVTIDTSAYPGCGFRIAGATVDIECSCGGYLCPLGASSCANAATLLASENLGAVCAQQSAGSCVQGTPVATTTGASSSGSSSCDTTCRDECAGEPTCVENCGC